MTAQDELRHKDIWQGKYKEVGFEIAKWFGGNVIWNYYIVLRADQIPKKYTKELVLKGKYITYSEGGRKHLVYDYMASEFMNRLRFAGGITYYSKMLDGEGKLLAIKMGCDYNHLWDGERGYSATLEGVFADTKNTIDKLQELIPELVQKEKDA